MRTKGVNPARICQHRTAWSQADRQAGEAKFADIVEAVQIGVEVDAAINHAARARGWRVGHAHHQRHIVEIHPRVTADAIVADIGKETQVLAFIRQYITRQVDPRAVIALVTPQHDHRTAGGCVLQDEFLVIIFTARSQKRPRRPTECGAGGIGGNGYLLLDPGEAEGVGAADNAQAHTVRRADRLRGVIVGERWAAGNLPAARAFHVAVGQQIKAAGRGRRRWRPQESRSEQQADQRD